MIRVVMTDNKPVETYKTGSKFTINQTTGNLHVYNDAKEEIAVHAHGTWASVSVDNSQKYADKLTSEMISGEWNLPTPQVTIHNYAGTQVEVTSPSAGDVEIIITKAIREKTGKVIADQVNDPNSSVSRSIQKNLDSGRKRL